MMEEAHEAHFRSALRISAVVAGAIEHERTRGPWDAVRAESDLVKQPRRDRAPAARLKVDIEHLCLNIAGRSGERGDQRSTLAGNDIGELQVARANLRQVLIQP